MGNDFITKKLVNKFKKKLLLTLTSTYQHLNFSKKLITRFFCS